MSCEISTEPSKNLNDHRGKDLKVFYYELFISKINFENVNGLIAIFFEFRRLFIRMKYVKKT